MGRWAIVNGLLGLFVLLLALEIGHTWSRALPPVEIVQRAASDSPAGKSSDPPTGKAGGKGRRGERNQPAKVEQSPAAMVGAIVDRELFDPSRTKPTEEMKAVKTAPVVNPPANVTVVGVRVFGKDREVFITENNQPRRLRVGDQVSGYTVKKIQPTEVTLASPTGDVIPMPLNVEKGKGGTAPKPPTPGAPAPGPRPPGAAPGPSSPAAGVVGQASPAAGIQPKPPPPAPRVPGKPAVPGAPVPAPAAAAAGAPAPPPSALPTDVKQRLEQLKDQRQNRMGHK